MLCRSVAVFMVGNFASLMKYKAINGWSLFWVLSTLVTAFTLREITRFDLSQPADVSQMIGYSVRWAVPFIYFVLAASAMPVLLPGSVSQWWLRSRKYVGLVFAVAMAWQGAFIFMMSSLYTDYYYSDIYVLRDESEGTSGYLLLAAMVFTSFKVGRQWLTAAQWKTLHRCGVYFLWAYPFSVYWWNLFYYPNPEALDYAYYWVGFLAFAVRIAAWGKKRQARSDRSSDERSSDVSGRLIGGALITGGLVAAATGDFWLAAVNGVLVYPAWSASLEIWFPFWPFEPFLSLLLVGVGTAIFTRSDRQFATGKSASVGSA
jgi:hypothetical protein